MYRLSTSFVAALVLMAGPTPAPAQDFAKTREAMAIISQTAESLCRSPSTDSSRSGITLSGEGKAQLGGLISKLADLGLSGSANYTSQQTQGVLQEQLAPLLQQSQNCREVVFNRLVDILLINNSGRSISMIEGDVALYCEKLRGWPYTSVNEETVAKFEELLKEIDGQRNNARSRTLALVNRCMGAAYLAVAGEPPDKIRRALPYLNRSLAFDPDQALLRDNIVVLTSTVQAGRGDADRFITAMVQVIRGSNDPDIPELVKQIKSVMQKNN